MEWVLAKQLRLDIGFPPDGGWEFLIEMDECFGYGNLQHTGGINA